MSHNMKDETDRSQNPKQSGWIPTRF